MLLARNIANPRGYKTSCSSAVGGAASGVEARGWSGQEFDKVGLGHIFPKLPS